MDELQDLLVKYNNKFQLNLLCSWSRQFCQPFFPSYWTEVHKALSLYDKNSKVVEIGCGYGDVTSILCHLGYVNITAYERDADAHGIATQKIATLFGRKDIVRNCQYPEGIINSDILIMVNCVYADGATNKEEYMDKIISFYEFAGRPQVFIYEAVDSSYIEPDDDFPSCVRLSSQDISNMFECAHIYSFETYKFPQNRRTKKLYIIETTL